MKRGKFDKFIVAEYNSANYHDVCQLRTDVFVVEQKIKETDEFDGIDKKGTQYYCGYVNEYLVASVVVFKEETLLKTARVARVLVSKAFRGQGYGSSIIKLMIDDIKKRSDYDYLLLNSQEAMKGFYMKLGFENVNNKNIEAGIPHIFLRMSLR